MITLTNVSKRFDDVWAVNNVSLTMQEGSVFGLIGTNGAGKTTLVKLICGSSEIIRKCTEFVV